MGAAAGPHHALADLAEEVAARSDPPEIATRLCDLVIRSGTAEGVSVIAGPRHGGVLAASDAVAGALARWQAEHEEGPAIDACRQGQPVLLPRLDHEHHRRWPTYTPRAVEAGVRSLWSVPMLAAGRCAGALEGHRARPGAIGAGTVADATGLATLGGLLLLDREAGERAAREADRLGEALRHRVLVEQARGRLAERHGTSVEAALTVLSEHARAHGLRLHEVARDVAEGRLRL